MNKPIESKRRLATILAADVAGYSRLMDADEEATYEAIRSARSNIIEPGVTAHGGRIVKHMGDGFLAEFPSVVEAVRFAMEMQEQMLLATATIPPDSRVRFRIGINLGDIIVAGDGDIFGDGVNVAARLETLAIPGGICISAPVHHSVHKKLNVRLDDLGEQKVKNISTPVRVYDLRWPGEGGVPKDREIRPQSRRHRSTWFVMGALALLITAVAYWQLRPAKPLAPEKSIAVMPFVDMSGDGQNEYFSQGIAEELLNLLARIPDLKVSSRTSSFHFAGQDVPISSIASALGVRHILEGSVRRNGSDVRISAQLIDTTTDSHVWSDTYEQKVLDVFSAQLDIARVISERLKLKLDGVSPPTKPTSIKEAYDLYLRGWHALRQGWSSEDYLEALDYFEQAIDLDPGFAQAHALHSVANLARANFRYANPTETYPAVLEHAEQAIGLDDSLPDAYVAMGWVQLSYQYDWRAAEWSFRRAMELAPSYYMGHLSLAWALQGGGFLDAALRAAQRAFELDPMTLWTRNGLAEMYYKQRNFPAALREASAMLEMNPDDPLLLSWTAILHARMGQIDEAKSFNVRAVQAGGDDPNFKVFSLQLQTILGEREIAMTDLERLSSAETADSVSPGGIAATYALLGEAEMAVAWLQRAVDAYDSYVFNLNYPEFDPIRADPGFRAICEQVQLDCDAPQKND